MNSEETQTARLYAFLGWLDRNKKRLIYAAVVVAVVSSSWYVYDYLRAQKELQAGAALLGLHKMPEGTGKAPPPAAAAYLQVAGDYPGTSAAEQAMLLAGTALFTENKFKEARDKFQEFTTKYADQVDSPMLAAAALGKAACLDALEKTKEAIEEYEQVIKTYPNDPAAAQAKLATAYLYEVKEQPEQALKLYNELAPSDGSLDRPSLWTREVEPRREQLLLKHPLLAASILNAIPKPIKATVPPKVTVTKTNASQVLPKVPAASKAGATTNSAPRLFNAAPAPKNP